MFRTGPRLAISALLVLVSAHWTELISGQDHDGRHDFDVRVISPTSPDHGIPGKTKIELTAVGFRKGRLESDDVTIALSPREHDKGKTASTHPLNIKTLDHRTRLFTFVIPTSISVVEPTPYSVKISGKYEDGTFFDSDDSAFLKVEPSASVPVLFSVSPDTAQPGQTLSITITGKHTHFRSGVTEANFGPGISVGKSAPGAFGPVNVQSSDLVIAHIKVDAAARGGARTVVVRSGSEEASLSDGFSVSAGPVANPGGPYTATVGQMLKFDASKSTAPAGQQIVSYAWNFGDGGNGTGVTPTHAYLKAGTFSVSLTVTDNQGATNTASTTAAISTQPVAPVANPGGPYAGTVGQPVAFDGTKSTAPRGQSITSYAWNFGDGATGTGATPTHTYSKAGTFSVSLAVTDTTGGAGSASTTVTIATQSVGPVANAGGPYTGMIGQPVTFDGSKSTGPAGQTLSDAWNFGDSSTGTGVSPTHSYSTAGTFTVSLTVTASGGGANTATTTASINQSAPFTITSFSPTSGPAGTLVSVTLNNFNPVQGAAPQVTLAAIGGGSISAPISSFSANAISFVIPSGAASGNITIASGGHTVTSSGTFSVTTSSSFTISVGPASANLIQGQQVNYAVALKSTNGFNQTATLAVSGVPSGVTAAFQPTVITAGQSSILTLKAPAKQARGTTVISVSASAMIDGQNVTQSTTAALNIIPVTTTLLGRTVAADALETPLTGVTVTTLGNDGSGNTTNCSGFSTVSDAAGNFALTSLPSACSGPQVIVFDASKATGPPGKYGGARLIFTLTNGQVTAAPVLVHLPRIDNAETVSVKQNAPTDQKFVSTAVPGLSFTVYAGTILTLPDGTQPDPFPMGFVPVLPDRLPSPASQGTSAFAAFYLALEPNGTHASQPVAVTYPNVLNMPPGTKVQLTVALNSAASQLLAKAALSGKSQASELKTILAAAASIGTATVSADGSVVVPDADPAHPGHAFGESDFDW
jgi:PKD repeat protein